MRGQVVYVAWDEGDGIIRGDNGNRYPYAIAGWLSPEQSSVGASVDFEAVDGRATMICAIPSEPANQQSGFVAFAQRHKVLLVGLAVLPLLLILINAASVKGAFSNLIGDPHGPIKTYQVTGLANVRDKPTATGSTVLRQLNLGDSFSGRIYLSPDGQKQWVKSEGTEEYVSIVNLTETSATPSSTTEVANASAVQDGAEFIGVWLANMGDFGGYHNVARIEQNGASYLIRFTSDGGQFVGMRGVFPANYVNGTLQTNNSALGSIAYSPSDQSIYVAGIRFIKTSEEGEMRRANDEQAAAQAQQEAKAFADQARNEENARKAAETHRLGLIEAHIYNCYNSAAQCDEAAEDARKYPADSSAMLRKMNGNPANPPWSLAVLARAKANHTTPGGLDTMAREAKMRARWAGQSKAGQ